MQRGDRGRAGEKKTISSRGLSGVFWRDWLSKRDELELEDDADGSLRAPLVSAEILRAHRISSDTQRPAGLEGQVNSAAKGVSEGVLIAKGRLRREVRDTDQGMGPDFEAATSGPTEARSATAKREPGTDVILRTVGGGKVAFGSDPILEVIDHVDVEAVGVFSEGRQLIKAEEGVADVELPGVVLENAGHILRRRRGCERQRERSGGGSGRR